MAYQAHVHTHTHTHTHTRCIGCHSWSYIKIIHISIGYY